MTRPRRRSALPDALGPFHYQFRPSSAGRFDAVLIRAPLGAPLPRCGDAITLTTRDCYDADFEVTQVNHNGEGWWIGCERKPR
ncbi:hypothetical protein [Caulobacter endophyticus]|uniref:hypothetical protein n=1 Tax=Caulobacter endophyticus TaxID=2172652 RepID=UPI0011B1FC14|nr:hypothetical protein [Caulobacter endophyticus]